MNEEWVLVGEKDAARRYRRIAVHLELLAQILGGGFRDVVPLDPVPDLRIVGARVSSWRAVLELLVTSEMFAPVSEAEIEPEWSPSFQRVTRDEVPA